MLGGGAQASELQLYAMGCGAMSHLLSIAKLISRHRCETAKSRSRHHSEPTKSSALHRLCIVFHAYAHRLSPLKHPSTLQASIAPQATCDGCA
jgi:hypothetical protein